MKSVRCKTHLKSGVRPTWPSVVDPYLGAGCPSNNLLGDGGGLHSARRDGVKGDLRQAFRNLSTSCAGGGLGRISRWGRLSWRLGLLVRARVPGGSGFIISFIIIIIPLDHDITGALLWSGVLEADVP